MLVVGLVLINYYNLDLINCLINIEHSLLLDFIAHVTIEVCQSKPHTQNVGGLLVMFL